MCQALAEVKRKEFNAVRKRKPRKEVVLSFLSVESAWQKETWVESYRSGVSPCGGP